MNMQEYATKTAGKPLYNVANIAAFGAKAIAGKSASPSFEIALPISAENGTDPFKYNVVTIIWGPQPGIKPNKIAIKGTKIIQMSKNIFKSIPVKYIKIS